LPEVQGSEIDSEAPIFSPKAKHKKGSAGRGWSHSQLSSLWPDDGGASRAVRALLGMPRLSGL
jgi:hypothetical protein